MSSEIAAIIIALGGLGGLAGLVGTILSNRRASRSDKNASMVSNYQTLYAEMRKEIDRVRDEQREERKQWAEERKRFNTKIDDLQELIRTQDESLHAKDIEVTQLRGKVDLLQSQLDTYRDIHTQAKNVTIKT